MVHCVFGLASLLLCLPAAALAAPGLVHVDVFRSGADGYGMYRIPAIEIAPDGSLLAFAEARKFNGGDPGVAKNEIDLVMKRSVDGGRTWSAMKLIEHAGELWSSANPATVVDRSNRRVWLLYLRSKPNRSTETSRPGTDDFGTFARTSDDCGLTWSEPIDLTDVARDNADSKWAASVVGPGGAIQTRSGRLLFACWLASPYQPFCLYSDDHGVTWQRGERVPGAQGGNECQVVEQSDGSILMDIRQNSGPNRWLAVSRDGGRTFGLPVAGQKLGAVACGIERLSSPRSGHGHGELVWTGNPGYRRERLVARVSLDEGMTYQPDREIYSGPAAYSDLVRMGGNRIGVLWERDEYRTITFTVLTRSWLQAK